MSNSRTANWPTRSVLGLLRAYRLGVSPWLPAACRYIPTCSEYASAAVSKHGVVKGVPKAVGRLLRCHPFHPGGVDLPD